MSADGRRWRKPDDPRRVRALAIAGQLRALSSEAQSLALATDGIDTKRVALARSAQDCAAAALRIEKEFDE